MGQVVYQGARHGVCYVLDLRQYEGQSAEFLVE
jgi:hypothetical protein